jgi:hypothetical protein
MANNFNVYDSGGTARTIKTTDNSTVHTPHHNVDIIAGGASADIGAVADAAIITDAVGSLSGKLRGLVKWAFERMPAALGQTTMSASLPVVIASNQTGIPLTAGAAMIGGVRDDGPFQSVSQQYTTSADMSGGVVSITAAPTSGKRIFLDGILVSCGTTMEVTLKEQTSGTVLSSFFVLANTPFSWTPKNRLQAAVADKTIQAITSASGQIRITCFYHSEV